MKTNELDPRHLWKQLEDVLAPRLRLTAIEHVVYSHLLRHSLLEGKRRLRFSLIWLARNLGISRMPVRNAVHRLDELRALRILERSKSGHVVEMRLPEEIRAPRDGKAAPGGATRLPRGASLEETDFMKTFSLRGAIHSRDGGRCFYCLRLTPARMHCLDHVVPRARSGRNSYRNLVSCCMECNSAKRETPAPDFLRSLYRAGRLTPADLTDRLRALKDLAAGNLRPSGLDHAG
jgi:HNH endonuclease